MLECASIALLKPAEPNHNLGTMLLRPGLCLPVCICRLKNATTKVKIIYRSTAFFRSVACWDCSHDEGTLAQPLHDSLKYGGGWRYLTMDAWSARPEGWVVTA